MSTIYLSEKSFPNFVSLGIVAGTLGVCDWDGAGVAAASFETLVVGFEVLIFATTGAFGVETASVFGADATIVVDFLVSTCFGVETLDAVEVAEATFKALTVGVLGVEEEASDGFIFAAFEVPGSFGVGFLAGAGVFVVAVETVFGVALEVFGVPLGVPAAVLIA